MSSFIRVVGDPPQVAKAIEGETILESLLHGGIAFPHNCQSGNCGACKCELVEGDTLELPSSEYALSPEERGRGLILACRTQVWGDCTVRALDDGEVVLHPSRVNSPPVNALSHALRVAMKTAFTTAIEQSEVKAILLCCSGRTFVAGADIREFDSPPLSPDVPDAIPSIQSAAPRVFR